MKPTITQGIVLARVNYQEADRILTVLTNDQGKLRLIAKGVRKVKSKLAGGVELFSISELSVIKGKGEIGTLVSSRLIKHFELIVKNLDRTMYAYEFLKLINKITEDNAEPEYYQLLCEVLSALNTEANLELVKLWADMQLLSITGHSPNVTSDLAGEPLEKTARYDFDSVEMSFSKRPDGPYQSAHIKLLRLLLTQPLSKLVQVQGIDEHLVQCQQFAQAMRRNVLYV